MSRAAWFCQDCRVLMRYNKQQDFYECPQCGTEVWPNSPGAAAKDEVLSLMRDMAPTHRETKVLPVGCFNSGGSKKSSKSRKKSMKKETLATLNKKLYVEC